MVYPDMDYMVVTFLITVLSLAWAITASMRVFELKVEVDKLKEAGIDEVIVAYREIADLQAAARLIESEEN